MDPSVLDVPAELGDGPTKATKTLSLVNYVLEIILLYIIVGGLV